MFFTGELPRNSIVELSGFNRPDQEPFIQAMKKSKPGYENDPGTRRVMGFKCPMAFDWPQNQAWKAEERLRHRISLESQKNPGIWGTAPGEAALAVSRDLKKITDAGKWNKESAEEVYDRMVKRKKASFSEKEMVLFRWMCFHIYLGGTPDSNPEKNDVFMYFHGNTGTQCDFMFNKMSGPGMTGLYASCGYVKYSKELETWYDEHTAHVTDTLPLMKDKLEWLSNKKESSTSSYLVCVVGLLMNDYQLHHCDMAAVFALTQREWEIWCQQWYIYKRDAAIGTCYGVVPTQGVRYEKVCVYLEALTRIGSPRITKQK